MVRIELQDPLSTEVKSPTIAGAIEALNRITKALDLNPESVERAPMNPVPGLDSSDPRRIYQVEAGNRLWLDSSTPEIYVNGSRIYESSRNFTIDYIGGSITFTGSYRPSSSDVVTASFNHISSEFKVLGGSEIIINFSSDLLGQPFTVTGGENETHTGVVDSSYKSVVRVKGINTTYIVSIESPGGETHTAEVEVGPYYGKFEVSISSFSATIKVTAVEGAIVTASMSGYSVSGEAGSDGTVTLTVANSGNYTVSATYSGAKSNSKSVQVSQSGQQYTTNVNFITLTVTAPEGSTITVKNGGTTLSDTGGTVKFWLPNTGTWTVTAELGDNSTSSEVHAIEYKDYPITLSYAPTTLNDATWAEISQISSSGQAANTFSVGDQKTITFTGNGRFNDYMRLTGNIDVFIVGINHNASVEGSNLIHFCMGKSDGQLCVLFNAVQGNDSFADGTNNDTNSAVLGCYDTYVSSSEQGSNRYGFGLSGISYLCGKYVSNLQTSNIGVIGSLPTDLRAVMKNATKYYDTESSISSIELPMSIPSVYELRGFHYSGTETWSDQNQQQYEYFKSGNSYSAKGLSFNSSGNQGIDESHTGSTYWLRNRVSSSMDPTKRNYIAMNGNGSTERLYDGTFNFACMFLFFV